MTGDSTCHVDGCKRPHKARGFCAAHYNAWRRARKATLARIAATA